MSSAGRRALLCVDLDGTLVATDTLDECLVCLLRHRPWLLLLVPLWLLGGKARFKERVAAAVLNDGAVQFRAVIRPDIRQASVNSSSFPPLPYRPEVMRYIDERAEDDDVVLATAANWRIAQLVAQQCEFVTHVLASDERTNLSGARKLAAIQAYADGRPFDYIGDHAQDLPIWQASRQAIVVSGSPRLRERINGASRVTQISSGTSAGWRDWLRQLRVHQWSKNLLLALPLILAHQLTSPPALFACAVAIAAFSFAASAVYIVNDLIDLPHDRTHPTKSKRPLARGALSIRQAALVAAALTALAALLSVAVLPWLFLAMLVGYGTLSLVYSLWLKRMAIVDVIFLAGFYVYRVLIGAVAIEVPASFWLLAFSMFFFLALGTMKRYADLNQAANSGKTDLAGRSYTTSDLEFLRSLGLTCSGVAVLVLALYVESDEVENLYRHPAVLWLVCPLALYWIMRAWLVASRGQMPDDPIVFALRDRASYVIATLTGLLILLATL